MFACISLEMHSTGQHYQCTGVSYPFWLRGTANIGAAMRQSYQQKCASASLLQEMASAARCGDVLVSEKVARKSCMFKIKTPP